MAILLIVVRRAPQQPLNLSSIPLGKRIVNRGLRRRCYGRLGLLDATIPGENLDAPFLQLNMQMLDNENEVALDEAHRYAGNYGGKCAQAN
jgi:hypothetical protein